MVKGYGIQEKVIQKLKELGCEEIQIHKQFLSYKSKFSDWLKPEIKVLDYGHGKQRFFPLKDMRII